MGQQDFVTERPAPRWSTVPQATQNSSLGTSHDPCSPGAGGLSLALGRGQHSPWSWAVGSAAGAR